jgi:hypothetical protein
MAIPIPPRPKSIIAQVAGSGTAAKERVISVGETPLLAVPVPMKLPVAPT